MVTESGSGIRDIPVGSMGVALTGTFNATEPKGPNR
jgi:hypothetical protein